MAVNDLRVAQKMTQLHQSAKKRNIEFDLSLRKVRQLLTRKTCFYTGQKFTAHNGRSIDRVDNDKGYTDENTVACGVHINHLKANLTVHELDMLYKKVHQFIDK